MRPHGRSEISATNPRARGVCDFCGFIFNHDKLQWAYQWRGRTLQNIRFLVCPTCYDTPQEQLKTIILPPDPVPILNARPENYVQDDNPQSNAGVSANFLQPQYGNRIGNLSGGGGINAAFDGNPFKPAWLCANNSISNSSYNNYVGINWTGSVGNLNMPSSMMPPVVVHSLVSFTAYAPLDRSFLGNTPTSYVVQYSPVDTSLWGAWTTISSGVTAGTVGETITAQCVGAESQFHRIAFLGDQTNPVAIAQVQFNIAQTGDITVPST